MKLSIVTITYQDPVGLRATLSSLKPLLASSVQWEHVIVDSSPEVSLPILENWPARHVTMEPQGIYAAFNKGLEVARGDFIWFLNSGDRLKSIENLKQVLGEFDRDPSVEILCAAVDVFRGDRFTYTVFAHEDFSRNLLGQNGLCHQGMIYRHSVFEKVGGFNDTYRLAGDYEHHLRCVLKGVKVGVVRVCLAEFDRAGRSDHFEETFEEFRAVWRKFQPRFPFAVGLQHEAFGLGHYWKLRLMRSRVVKPVAEPLKSAWYRVNRFLR